MECNKEHLLLCCFDLRKIAAEANKFISKTYSESASSVKTCEYLFQRFKSNDLKERSDQPKKFENVELQTLLDENIARKYSLKN